MRQGGVNYTQIENSLLDAIIKTKLSGQEVKIILLVIRKSYVLEKKSGFISLTQMADSLRCSKIRCAQVVKTLELMQILTVKENINGIGKSYSINHDIEKWVLPPKVKREKKNESPFSFENTMKQLNLNKKRKKQIIMNADFKVSEVSETRSIT